MNAIVYHGKLIFFLLITLIFSNLQNKKACEIFTKNLIIIKEVVDKRSGHNVAEISAAIDFLEKVTSIDSHSDGNYVGRYQPKKEDYTSWRNWYKKNKLRLYWDDNDKQVKVRPAY